MNVTAKAGTGREVVIVKEISAVEEKPIPHWNKGKGVLRVGPHPAKLSPCEKEPKEFPDPRKQMDHFLNESKPNTKG